MKINETVWTLDKLKELIGEEQLERLFLEHYLELIGKDRQNTKVADGLTLDDIME